MIGLTSRHSYFVYGGHTDMRKGFDGLSGMVITHLGRDPMDGAVYIFINKRRDKMKMLVWESGGFMLYYKRLEQGTFDMPKANDQGQIAITWETLVMMISGVKIEKVQRKKRYKRA